MSTGTETPDFLADLARTLELSDQLTELRGQEKQSLGFTPEDLFQRIQTLNDEFITLVEHLMTEHEEEMAARVEKVFAENRLVVQSTTSVLNEYDPSLVSQVHTEIQEEPRQ